MGNAQLFNLEKIIYGVSINVEVNRDAIESGVNHDPVPTNVVQFFKLKHGRLRFRMYPQCQGSPYLKPDQGLSASYPATKQQQSAACAMVSQGQGEHLTGPGENQFPEGQFSAPIDKLMGKRSYSSPVRHR
ncbi:hypothetical protein [Vogesella indigofera]|uniref:hypothetical protein n=1 Tax=Vogesella indigofera TaxID=45465 RepID=UPI00234EBBCE|nr:hypothetical protein [Vogesella indigofera]MDC7707646.1 hypothetical protein [Vogesella indigofera]